MTSGKDYLLLHERRQHRLNTQQLSVKLRTTLLLLAVLMVLSGFILGYLLH